MSSISVKARFWRSKIATPFPFPCSLFLVTAFLSSDDLLNKCFHGNTQNNNEYLNNIIWKRCPKDTFVSRQVIEMGVSSAVISFTSGNQGMLVILNDVNLFTGIYTEIFCIKQDRLKVEELNIKCSKKNKKAEEKI